MKRVWEWRTIVLVLIVISGAVGAAFAGSNELAIALGGIAGGLLVPTRLRREVPDLPE